MWRCLRKCQVSQDKLNAFLSRIRNLNQQSVALGKNDLIVFLDDLAYGLIAEIKGNNSGNDLIKDNFFIRGDISRLRRVWSEKRSRLSRLLFGEEQIMVVAQQITNDTYPPKFVDKVMIQIFRDRKILYEAQIDGREMSLSYCSLALAIFIHEKALWKITKGEVKKILTKFWMHYFDIADLKNTAYLENLPRDEINKLFTN